MLWPPSRLGRGGDRCEDPQSSTNGTRGHIQNQQCLQAQRAQEQGAWPAVSAPPVLAFIWPLACTHPRQSGPRQQCRCPPVSALRKQGSLPTTRSAMKAFLRSGEDSHAGLWVTPDDGSSKQSKMRTGKLLPKVGAEAQVESSRRPSVEGGRTHRGRAEENGGAHGRHLGVPLCHHSALWKLPGNAGPFQRALSQGTPAQQHQGDQRGGQGVLGDGSHPRHLHRTHGTVGRGPRLVVSGPTPPAQAVKYPGPCDLLQPEGKGRVPCPAARGQCGCDCWADESLSAGSCCLSPTPTSSSSVAKTGDSSPRAHGPQIPPLEVETKITPQRQACLLVRQRLPG